MIEIWKNIDGYEGDYQVSNLGKIKSFKTFSDGHIKATGKLPNGYHMVSFYKNGSAKAELLHRVVAKYFIDNPENKPEVNHIDGDKTNNNVGNLEWCTSSENQLHAHKNGLQKVIRGSKVYNAKLTEYNVLQIRSIYENGWFTQQEIADAYSVDCGNISAIINNKRWKHI